MKEKCRKLLCGFLMLLICANFLKAQEKWEVTVGADIVNSFIWRGMDCGDISIQPSITIAKSGFSLSAWGSTGINKPDYEKDIDIKELDFILGYENGGFNVELTDYYYSYGGNYFNYGAHTTEHVFEATVAYDFGPAAISWSTNFAGADYVKADGGRAYSSYFEIAAPFRIGGLDFTAELGVTPWEGLYSAGSKKFSIVNVGIGVTKDIRVAQAFSFPVFAKITVNRRVGGTYFSFGLSL